MKFFTDKTVENEYLLIKIQDYIKMRKKGKSFSKWKEIFIDPGVYALKKNPIIPFEKEIHISSFLDSLPKNHYLSMDFPSDMNLNYKNFLLDKSWQYSQAFCYHPQFIVTVQFLHNNYWSFRKWFDRYNSLDIKSYILGIGNLCQIHECTEFIKHLIPYVMKYSQHKRIHVYGLAFKNILFTYKWALKFNIDLSIDSTKWTRPITNELKKQCGISCSREHRQLYFNTYLEAIRSKGIILENEIRTYIGDMNEN